MAKAKEDSIFLGQFIAAGEEFPKEHAELSKPKGNRPPGMTNFANQVGATGLRAPSQEMRPGMSGSGKEQENDIVDGEGNITQPEKGEGEGSKSSSSKKSESKK